MIALEIRNNLNFGIEFRQTTPDSRLAQAKVAIGAKPSRAFDCSFRREGVGVKGTEPRRCELYSPSLGAGTRLRASFEERMTLWTEENLIWRWHCL